MSRQTGEHPVAGISQRLIRPAICVGIDSWRSFKRPVRDAMPCVRVDPALETPGYRQRSLRDRDPLQRR